MMTKAIKSFVAEANSLDSIVMIIFFIVLGGLVAMGYAYYCKARFNKSWDTLLNSLKFKLDFDGRVMVLSLIDIAMLKADKYAGKAIGKLEKEIEDTVDDADFLSKLLEFIEGINDRNHTVILNSDYATARETIKKCLEIIDKHVNVGTFEDFADLAVKVAEAKAELSVAVKNIERILSGLTESEQENLAIKEG